MISDELEVLKIVANKLDSAGIKYIISGSVAANFYAQPRMTRDIDIVIWVTAFNADSVYDLFKEDFYIDKDSVDEAIRNMGMFNIIHNELVVKVDFIVAGDSEYNKMRLKRKKINVVEGVSLSIISPEDLILSKLLWAKDSHSEIQFRDVRNVLAFNKNRLDLSYLEEWAAKLTVKSLLEGCLKNA